jgi:hypothetical protein
MAVVPAEMGLAVLEPMDLPVLRRAAAEEVLGQRLQRLNEMVGMVLRVRF